jgi:hypothetical protein
MSGTIKSFGAGVEPGLDEIGDASAGVMRILKCDFRILIGKHESAALSLNPIREGFPIADL